MSTYGKNHYALKNASAPVVRRAIQTLFEEKHLYQSIKIEQKDLSPAIETILTRERRLLSSMGLTAHSAPIPSLKEIEQALNEEADDFLRKIPFGEKPSGQENHNVEFTVDTIRTYCGSLQCKKTMPHNICNQPIIVACYEDVQGNIQQVISFTYLCQNCKKGSVSFLVRRDGHKLTLSGRTPMEHIETPSFIPVKVRKFYQGAVIAFNSGANLPAIFMLRTAIEQHMRNAVDAGDAGDFRMTGEDLADEYAKTLDDDFHSRFQSLKPVYETLSGAIHAANDNSPAIFEEEMQKVLNHFEVKEMFERMAPMLVSVQI